MIKKSKCFVKLSLTVLVLVLAESLEYQANKTILIQVSNHEVCNSL